LKVKTERFGFYEGIKTGMEHQVAISCTSALAITRSHLLIPTSL